MKKAVLITSIGLFFLIMAGFFIFFRSAKNPQPSPFFPTPTSVLDQYFNEQNKPLEITSVFPTNKAQNITTDTKITISFNKYVSMQDFTFTFAPEIDYDATISGKAFTVTPKTPLNPGSIYYYIVKFPNGSFSQQYRFTTAGQGPASNPATDDNLRQLQNAWDKSFAPDVFVANHAPYSTNDFSVSSNHQDTPPEHYYFSVFLNGDQNITKQAFLGWLKSLGLIDSQIASLDISYYSGGF